MSHQTNVNYQREVAAQLLIVGKAITRRPRNLFRAYDLSVISGNKCATASLQVSAREKYFAVASALCSAEQQGKFKKSVCA